MGGGLALDVWPLGRTGGTLGRPLATTLSRGELDVWMELDVRKTG